MKLEKPKLLLGDTEKELITTAGVASEILKFSNKRKDIPVENYLQEHINILAIAFGVTADEVRNNVSLAVVVTKYFEILEYIARVISSMADGDNHDDEDNGDGGALAAAV